MSRRLTGFEQALHAVIADELDKTLGPSLGLLRRLEEFLAVVEATPAVDEPEPTEERAAVRIVRSRRPRRREPVEVVEMAPAVAKPVPPLIRRAGAIVGSVEPKREPEPSLAPAEPALAAELPPAPPIPELH